MRARGLSLVETIFAAFILGLTGMALLSVLPTSVMAEKRAQNRIMAEAIALSALEEARVGSFAGLTPGTSPETERTLNETTFKIVRVVTDESARLKSVRMQVRWDEAGWGVGQKTRSVVVEGLVYNVNR